VSNRDLHSGARRDRHRKQATLREKAQREEMEQFQNMSMLQKPPAMNWSMSAMKAEFADFNARLAIIEAELAQGTGAAPAKEGKFVRWISVAGLVLVLGLIVLLLARAKF
jgi:hypothetical protein